MNSQNLTVTFSYIRLLFNWKADIWQYLPGKTAPENQLFYAALPGLIRPAPVMWRWMEFTLKKEPDSYKDQIGYVSEELTYFMEKSALENGELLGPYFSNWSMERYYTLMDRMNFSPSKQLWQLSKGEYMKMQTCFALAHHPRFLILDEPLEGFDPVFRKNFLSIMQDILNEDVGIFISSHITETLKKLADYLLFADNGIITFHCPEQMDAFLADKLKRSHTHIRDLLSRNS